MPLKHGCRGQDTVLKCCLWLVAYTHRPARWKSSVDAEMQNLVGQPVPVQAPCLFFVAAGACIVHIMYFF